ncbi:hypothetical protein DCAR_0520072 [Daucus carota subsp. sativus]|uniref:Uncharacterized protein n=1 Tax=Daucus carota subsp. sativus TaxID=79200 RepID=A0A164YAM9_DAUCS|nr:hypothetical protein DCAR_0520072 [Daucus carota subsp. sativus]
MEQQLKKAEATERRKLKNEKAARESEEPYNQAQETERKRALSMFLSQSKHQERRDAEVNMKPKVPTKTVCEEHLELRKEILNLLNLRKQVYFVYFNSCDLHALLALLMILMFSVVTLPLCCNNFATGYMDLPLCFALLTARTQ